MEQRACHSPIPAQHIPQVHTVLPEIHTGPYVEEVKDEGRPLGADAGDGGPSDPQSRQPEVTEDQRPVEDDIHHRHHERVVGQYLRLPYPDEEGPHRGGDKDKDEAEHPVVPVLQRSRSHRLTRKQCAESPSSYRHREHDRQDRRAEEHHDAIAEDVTDRAVLPGAILVTDDDLCAGGEAEADGKDAKVDQRSDRSATQLYHAKTPEESGVDDADQILRHQRDDHRPGEPEEPLQRGVGDLSPE